MRQWRIIPEIVAGENTQITHLAPDLITSIGLHKEVAQPLRR
jgi:hypothetical protein